MVINNYSVAINTQYFNLQEESTNVKISTQKESFASDKSLEIETTAINSAQTTTAEDELSIELSKAVLKNISSEANRFLRDRVEMTYSYTEQESLNYQVQAFIQTDSKEIELSLDVSLSRSFTYKSNITIESLKALQDPLIISFDATMPTLSTETFSFDIDSDGESDQISQLGEGNAFLALDKNGNNKIDNGNELFGTATGDGFGDLSAYDDDK